MSLKKSFSKLFLALVHSLGIELDVWCEPYAWVKPNYPMNLLQDQLMFDGLVKSHDLDHILLLVEQIGNQLLDSTDFHLLT